LGEVVGNADKKLSVVRDYGYRSSLSYFEHFNDWEFFYEDYGQGTPPLSLDFHLTSKKFYWQEIHE